MRPSLPFSVEVSRSAALDQDDRVVSALVVRGGDWRTGTPVGYGTVGKVSGESGSVSFELPADFNKETDRLYLSQSELAKVPRAISQRCP